MRYSRVEPSFDFDEIDRAHDFYLVKSPKGRLGIYSPFFVALDLASSEVEIEAIAFGCRNEAWVMSKKGAKCRDAVRKAAREPDVDSTIVMMKPSAMAPRVLMRLFLASLSTTKFSKLPAGNLGGKLLIGLPEKSDRLHVVAVEVDVDPSMALTLRVRTFSSLMLKKKLEGDGWEVPFAALPRYRRTKSGFLLPIRGIRAKASEVYVPRVPKGHRSSVAMLDLSSIDSFRNTKMGILCEVVERLEARYGSQLKLSFAEVDNGEVLPQRDMHRNKAVRAWRAGVINSFNDDNIIIWDCAGCDRSDLNNLAGLIENIFSIKAEVANIFQAELLGRTPCIRIIESEEAYGRDDDPHNELLAGAATQHLTKKRLAKVLREGRSKNPILENCVKELAIKLDAFDGKARLFTGDGHRWVFGIYEKHNGTSRYLFVTLGQNGEISFESYDGLNDIPVGLKPIAYQLVTDDNGVEYAIMGPAGDINVAARTELYALPDFLSLEKQLLAGNNKLKGTEARERYFGDLCGLSFMPTTENHGYYRIGAAGPGMNSSLPSATILREVVAAPGSKLLFPEALKFLDVDYVRMRMLAVTPWPLKYLNEWLRERDRTAKRQ